MLVIPVHKNNIDRALKAFRYKFKKTQQLKKVRETKNVGTRLRRLLTEKGGI